MSNSHLTTVVTLKGRSEFTERLISYLDEVKYPHFVIFADGSLDNSNEKIFSGSRNMGFSYKYIRYKPDRELSDYYTKCLDAVENAETSYVMFADNDDFPIATGQQACVDFLDKNKKFIGCNGRVGGFTLQPDPSVPYGKGINFLDKYCEGMDTQTLLNQESPLDRIQSYLSNFYSIFYSVFRRDALLKTLKGIEKNDFQDLGIYELYFSYSMLIQGKIHSIPEYSYLRQKGSSQIASTQKDWFERVIKGSWLGDFHKGMQEIAKKIVQSETSNLETAPVYERLVSDFLSHHRKRFLQPLTKALIWNLFISQLQKKLFTRKITISSVIRKSITEICLLQS